MSPSDAGNAVVLEAEGVRVAVDLEVGHVFDLTVRRDGRAVSPLHRAPWVGGEETFPAATPANVRRLSGDFLCAPFGRNDVMQAPSHGWPANSPWRLVENVATPTGRRARLRLERSVAGAAVEKTLILRHGHPFLYQEHRFVGGSGGISAAHHTMLHMQRGGRLAFSPKRFAATPDRPLETDPARGRFLLAYPGRSEDLGRFPLAGGGSTDLSRFPPGARHEDFVALAEAPGSGIGWTIASRHVEQDAVLVLKNAADLPLTMLWMSNGGRDYAPWSGRHVGVLGIEDGRCSPDGHAASLGDNPLKAEGIPTAFALAPGRSVRFRQVIGAVPLARDAAALDVVIGDDTVTLSFEKGGTLSLPFDAAFLAQPMV